MAVEKKTRHERIYRLQRKLMAGVAALILICGGAATWWNVAQADTVSAETTTAQARAEFWQVAAGDRQPSNASSATRLATRLHEALESAPDSSTLPSEVSNLVVEPNDYPGIVSKLGFDPFDNTGLSCTSCGPLSAEMKDKLSQVQAGNVELLIDQELNSIETGSEIPLAAIIAWSTLIYVGGSMASVMMAVRHDSRRNSYAANTVDWRPLGSSDDTYKARSKRLGLPYFLVVVPIKKRLGKDYEAVLKETFMFNDERELTELQNAVRNLPPGQEREELQRILYELRDGIDAQVEAFRSPELTFEPAAAKELHGDIVSRISDFQQRIELRKQAADDLQGTYPTRPAANELHA